MNTPGYESLASVLCRAFDQAAKGKGAARHACARPFDRQPMQSISALVGSSDGLAYQAIKKIQESQRLDKDARVRELLGAINYVAGIIIYLEKEGMVPDTEPRERSQAREMAETMGRWSATTQWTCRHPGHKLGAGSASLPCAVNVGELCPVCRAGQGS